MTSWQIAIAILHCGIKVLDHLRSPFVVRLNLICSRSSGFWDELVGCYQYDCTQLWNPGIAVQKLSNLNRLYLYKLAIGRRSSGQ